MLELLNISKCYNPGTVNENTIFKDFSLKLDRGNFLAIIGSNGSGKSSLLNLVCGNILADSGQVILDGKDVSRLPEHKRYVKLGRVFQDPSAGTCPDMTLLENMALADNKNRPWNLTRAVDHKRLDYYREKLKLIGLGLENKLNEVVGSFSGGERQAVALLMATMTPIDYLILDEHTAALDPKAAELIMQLTENLVEEQAMTVLMVTHNLKHALTYGNRLIMLHQGKIIMDLEGRAKDELDLDDLLGKFFEISIEVGNSI